MYAAVQIDNKPIQFLSLKDKDTHWEIEDGYTFVKLRIKKKRVQILKRYYDMRLDQAQKTFAKDYPPSPSQDYLRMGVISPEGIFYPCSYGCHESLCFRLICALDIPQSYKTSLATLQDAGWIIINHHFLDVDDKGVFIDNQISTLEKILEAHLSAPKDTDWFDIITNNQEMYSCSTETMPKCTNQHSNEIIAQIRIELRADNAEILVEPISCRINAHPGD